MTTVRGLLGLFVFLMAIASAGASELSVSGRAVDASGRPIPEAEVLLLPAGDPVTKARLEIEGKLPDAAARGKTDAQGYFEILAPSAGLFHLRISGKGFVPVEHELYPLLESVELADATLRADSGLTVRVTGADGKGIFGATVRLAPPRSRFRGTDDLGWRSASRAGVAGEDGSVRLPCNEGEPLLVTASVPGFLVAERRNVRGTSTTLRLERGSERAITVAGPDGKPVAGALVATVETGHPLGFSDASGGLKVPVPPRGSLRVAIRTADGCSADGTLFPAPEPKAAARRFVLDPVQSLAGRVIDAESRRPLANAWVWRAGAPWAGVPTDASGRYSLLAAPGKRIEIVAGATGYLPAEPMVTRPEGRELRGPAIALRPAASIEGTVVDPTGAPVRGAKVSVDPRQAGGARMIIRMGAAPEPDAVTSSRGRFRIPAVDPEPAYDLRVRAAGFASASREIVGLDPRKPLRGLRIELSKGQRIVGRIVDREGRPVPDAEVTVRTARRSGGPPGFMALDEASSQDSASAFSDDSGRFGVGGLQAGTFDVSVRRSGFARRSVAGFEVKKGPDPADLGDLVLEAGESISGVVADPQGLPIEGVEVSRPERSGAPFFMARSRANESQPADAVTGPDGWFVIRDLKPGEAVELSFHRAGYVARNESGIGVPPPEPIRVTLQPASKVSGTVLDPDRKPVPAADVHLTRSRMSGGGGTVIKMMMREDATADDTGRFVFEGVEPGTISLSATAPGWQEARLDSVEVPNGADVDGIEIPLEPGAVVTGRVLGPDGRPAIGAEVNVVRDDADPMRFRGNPTDGDGRYRIEGVEPGKISVEATHDEYTRAVKDLEARPGANVLDLILGGGAEASGVVVDPSGMPVPGAWVRLAHPGRDWGGPEATAGGDGSFRFAGVGEGDWAVFAGKRGYAPSNGEVKFTIEGQPVSGLRVSLPPGGAIVGRITGVEPDRMAQVSVRGFGSRGEGFATGTPDREGAYRLDDLGPGRWVVTASIEASGERASGEAVLEAGAGEARLDLAFGQGLTLSGRAVHADAPVQDAVLFVQGEDVNHSGSGRTDRDGRFTVKGLEPGTYRVNLRQWDTGLSYSENVEVKGDREVLLDVPTARIAGTVVDAADRQPLAGVAITLAPPVRAVGEPSVLTGRGATTDLAGRFEIADLGDGEWTLTASRKGYAAETAPVVVQSGRGPSALRLDLEPTEGLTIEARLVSGRVPEEVTLVVLDPGGRPIARGSYATGENGRVRLSTVPPGAWEVIASAAGSGTATVRATAPGPPVPVVLPPACTLRISVPALAGTSVAATAVIRDSDGRPFRSLAWFSDPVAEWRIRGGETEIDSLPPGSWRVTVTAADGRKWEGVATTSPGAPASVALE